MEVKIAWDYFTLKSTVELNELRFSPPKLSLQYKIPLSPCPYFHPAEIRSSSRIDTPAVVLTRGIYALKFLP
jgi:hypothetical protein